MDKFKESDMYLPCKCFFENMGYTVNAEVRQCDLVALKGEHMVVVEFKANFSLQLIYQGLCRQKIADNVYVCVPLPKKLGLKLKRNMFTIVERCGLGLIFVAMQSPLKHVQVVVEPLSISQRKNAKNRKRIISEADGRTFDVNLGGSSRKKINTVYREKSIKIACAIDLIGATSVRALRKSIDLDEKTSSILNLNVYGWFEKVEKGVFSTSHAWKEFLDSGEFGEIVSYYRKSLEGKGLSL